MEIAPDGAKKVICILFSTAKKKEVGSRTAKYAEEAGGTGSVILVAFPVEFASSSTKPRRRLSSNA